MPIIIKTDHPAKKILLEENVFVIDSFRANHQDMRELKILLLNLMPNKVDTERQFLRLLANSPLQIKLDLIAPSSHNQKNTEASHFDKYYTSFEEIKNNCYDAMIVTGAPVEKMEFEEVDYFEQLKEILDFSKTNVTSTMFICWASQFALNYYYGIEKYLMEDKLFGVYPHFSDSLDPLVRGFDDISYLPHSRHTCVLKEDIEKIEDLDIILESKLAGVNIVASKNRRQIYIAGHVEYERNTLADEYFRDLSKNDNTKIPFNYFTNNDSSQRPIHKWRSHAFMLFNNWLNYYVYQATPYEIDDIRKKI
jgi:homoserine O-succinyltransferase